MDFLKKYGIFILIGVIVLFFLFRKKSTTASAGVGSVATQLITSRPSASPINPGTQVITTTPVAVTPTQTTTGTQSGQTVITRSQCKNICRGKCGRRCLIPIGRRCKTAKTCWNNCKGSYCGWIGNWNKNET